MKVKEFLTGYIRLTRKGFIIQKSSEVPKLNKIVSDIMIVGVFGFLLTAIIFHSAFYLIGSGLLLFGALIT